MRAAVGSYRYLESGLPNVFIDNVRIWRCPKGHKDVEIPAAGQLHEVIAKMILEQGRELTHRETQFVCQSLMMDAGQLAHCLGVDQARAEALLEGEQSADDPERLRLKEVLYLDPLRGRWSFVDLLARMEMRTSVNRIAVQVPYPLLDASARVRFVHRR
jgi:hypothetical protein